MPKIHEKRLVAFRNRHILACEVLAPPFLASDLGAG